MKQVAIYLLCLAGMFGMTPDADGQHHLQERVIHHWVDENGVKHFSNSKPPENAQVIKQIVEEKTDYRQPTQSYSAPAARPATVNRTTINDIKTQPKQYQPSVSRMNIAELRDYYRQNITRLEKDIALTEGRIQSHTDVINSAKRRRDDIVRKSYRPSESAAHRLRLKSAQEDVASSEARLDELRKNLSTQKAELEKNKYQYTRLDYQR